MGNILKYCIWKSFASSGLQVLHNQYSEMHISKLGVACLRFASKPDYVWSNKHVFLDRLAQRLLPLRSEVRSLS